MSSRTTKSRVVVDSSVWISHFRDPGAPFKDVLRELVDEDLAAVAGPIAYEVLQGARTPQEFDTAREILQELPWLPATSTTWISAAGMSAGLRRRGLTFPMTDILLATLGREHRCRIWSLDPHFTSIPGVRLYRPPKARPQRPRT